MDGRLQILFRAIDVNGKVVREHAIYGIKQDSLAEWVTSWTDNFTVRGRPNGAAVRLTFDVALDCRP